MYSPPAHRISPMVHRARQVVIVMGFASLALCAAASLKSLPDRVLGAMPLHPQAGLPRQQQPSTGNTASARLSQTHPNKPLGVSLHNESSSAGKPHQLYASGASHGCMWNSAPAPAPSPQLAASRAPCQVARLDAKQHDAVRTTSILPQGDVSHTLTLSHPQVGLPLPQALSRSSWHA